MTYNQIPQSGILKSEEGQVLGSPAGQVVGTEVDWVPLLRKCWVLVAGAGAELNEQDGIHSKMLELPYCPKDTIQVHQICITSQQKTALSCVGAIEQKRLHDQ